MKIRKILFWLFIPLLALALVFVGVAQGIILMNAQQKIRSLEDIQSAPVVIVFGASVIYNKYPSDILYDRVHRASELYFAGKVQKLLMTGDNSQNDYNEVQVMKETALRLGVAEEDIVLDYAGFRTYDSCARAHQIFGVDNAILVTQKFHLPRAIYLCEKFDVEVQGYAADRQKYRKWIWNEVREIAARTKAFYEVNLYKHDPKFLGEQEEIWDEEI